MRTLTFEELLRVHERLIGAFGGMPGILNAEPLKSALAHPFQTFDGKDLYPTLLERRRYSATC